MSTRPAACPGFSMSWSLWDTKDISAILDHMEIEATFETAASSTGTAVRHVLDISKGDIRAARSVRGRI
jgi:hypothetical protein